MGVTVKGLRGRPSVASLQQGVVLKLPPGYPGCSGVIRFLAVFYFWVS